MSPLGALWGACALGGVACGVLAAQILALRFWPKPPAPPERWPSLSILKPLYGVEPRLYECLRSFCCQDYPTYEIVFGVQDPEDPAVAVVRRLQSEFPALPVVLVVAERGPGSNAKVNNLINMMPQARHDILVLADADIGVGRDYLRTVAASLQDPEVGIVTCLYRGYAVGGLWSQMGCLFIQDWFVPQVLLAHAFGSTDFAFGATIALRRETLRGIGGFEALAFQLADDYELGARTRAQGLRTVLSSYLVETTVHESSLSDLFWHQLRWLRTIRVINPWGYAFAGLTLGFPVTLLVAIGVQQPLTWGLVFLALLTRLVLHWRACSRLRVARRGWLVPFSDLWLFGLWLAGFLGQDVRWRGRALAVCADGSMKVNRE